MPPPTKKRKTAAGAVPAGARRTTRSQRPGLSLEMIAKVATFAQYGFDLMNICLAVGPKESAVIRYTCLRNNLGYLEHCLKQYAARNLGNNQMHVKVSYWMEVNTDWRKLCTKERTEDDELSTPVHVNEEKEIVYRTDPLIVFNNPAVAIEFGMVNVLKHLVEEVGIDINAYRWGAHETLGTTPHLLSLSYYLSSRNKTVSKSIFEYVVSREDVDVCASVTRDDDTLMVWQDVLIDEYNDLAFFEAVVRHRSFDPNRGFAMYGYTCRPLHPAIVSVFATQAHDRTTNIAIEKVATLLKAGANPELATHNYHSPLDYVRFAIRREGEQSEQDKLCKALISMMEKYVN